jgi:hypothetical protein
MEAKINYQPGKSGAWISYQDQNQHLAALATKIAERNGIKLADKIDSSESSTFGYITTLYFNSTADAEAFRNLLPDERVLQSGRIAL